MSEKRSLLEKLNIIQTKLKASKNQYNSFGKYSYRSCEDILESLKPFLDEFGLIINLSDEVELIGDRFYIKAIAKLIEVETGASYETKAYAREAESKKGMDSAQVTGATSSYARKYALNGLLAIDDTKDNDYYDNRNLKQNNANSSKYKNNKNNDTKKLTLDEAKKLVLNFGDFNNISLGQLAKENIGAVKDLYKKAGNPKNKEACRLILMDYKKQMQTIKAMEKANKESNFLDKDFEPINEYKEDEYVEEA